MDAGTTGESIRKSSMPLEELAQEDGSPNSIQNAPPRQDVISSGSSKARLASEEHPSPSSTNETSRDKIVGLIVAYPPHRPGQLCKVPAPIQSAQEAHQIERRVYERLSPLQLPNLVRVVDMDEYGIWMERALPGCPRLFDKDAANAARISAERRLQWCEDVARVVAAVHRNGIRHADLSGRNLLIDKDWNILLCDFLGPGIDGDIAIIYPESGYRHPDKNQYGPSSIRCELHTLGSTLYEIVAACPVYDGTPKEEIDRRVEAGQYPSLGNIPLADIIQKYWVREFASADDVADAVARARRGGH